MKKLLLFVVCVAVILTTPACKYSCKKEAPAAPAPAPMPAHMPMPEQPAN